MYTVTVQFVIRKDAADEFLTLMVENAEASLQSEAGCLQFDVCWNQAEPTEIFLYEVYRDSAAFDAHLASAHFQTFDAAVCDMVVNKLVKTFERVQR